ncbi:hypothetical protein [Microcoleus phage My-WqHQDG]|nr:hypothetical protein [Microcoleus phage My-WqHQDG]
MTKALYGAIANVGMVAEPTVSTKVPSTSEALSTETCAEGEERKLIALVGRAGTGKHTYLEEYYRRLGSSTSNPIGRGNPVDYILLGYGFIERMGLHPREQQEYIDKVKGAGIALPNPYMFVTYSPYILDAMGWEMAHNVICFHRSEEGKFYRGSIQCHPESGWNVGTDETITLGKFWDAVGEDWLEEYGEDVTDGGTQL